ncbi:hypothetical protein O1M63_04535 [Streptomyces mirabilis]|nr:hypothetical protein [Streptomyces mirabilis]
MLLHDMADKFNAVSDQLPLPDQIRPDPALSEILDDEVRHLARLLAFLAGESAFRHRAATRYPAQPTATVRRTTSRSRVPPNLPVSRSPPSVPPSATSASSPTSLTRYPAPPAPGRSPSSSNGSWTASTTAASTSPAPPSNCAQPPTPAPHRPRPRPRRRPLQPLPVPFL